MIMDFTIWGCTIIECSTKMWKTDIVFLSLFYIYFFLYIIDIIIRSLMLYLQGLAPGSYLFNLYNFLISSEFRKLQFFVTVQNCLNTPAVYEE